MIKNIPLIIPVHNQYTYLKNLINWFRFYYPENPIYILDNDSTYKKLRGFYELIEFSSFSKKAITRIEFENINVVSCMENNFHQNLRNLLDNVIHPKYEYYVISDPDIMPHPSTPGNFLEIFKALIDDHKFHRAGFGLMTAGITAHNAQTIINNESGFLDASINIPELPYHAFKAPIDTTFCLYKTANGGWSSPMPGKDWGNCVRVFNAFHLPWHLDENNLPKEMEYYFSHCKRHIPGQPSAGANNYRPAKFEESRVESIKKEIKSLTDISLHEAENIVYGINEVDPGPDTEGMIKIPFDKVFDKLTANDAIINTEFTGFKEDYLALHCLLRNYAMGFEKFMEIGTNKGTGTKIIKNAIGPGVELYSLDLPVGESDARYEVGKNCDLPFIQIFGDSMKYSYARHGKIEGWFIDGAHTYDHVRKDSQNAIEAGGLLIIYHDANIPEVYNAIVDSFKDRNDYNVYRVIGTRIAYALAEPKI